MAKSLGKWRDNFISNSICYERPGYDGDQDAEEAHYPEDDIIVVVQWQQVVRRHELYEELCTFKSFLKWTTRNVGI